MNLPPIKHLRWYIAGLLCLASALNYLDRQTLSVLIGGIKEQLHLDNADYGKINAWFLASYGVMYTVSGRVIDLVGTRLGFMIFVTGWSVANMLHMFAATSGQFGGVRFLLGVFEPGSFTGGVRAVTEWFPMGERALAIGIFNAGTAIGSMVSAPVVSLIAFQFGWRPAFFVTGALGLVWVVGWYFFYQLPERHSRITPTEQALIARGKASQAAPERVSLGRLLRMRETWGCVLVRALTDPISYFLLFWIPLYFEKRHGFALKQIGLFVWIPFAAAALGSVASGALPRWLMARGWTLDRSRKTTMTLMTGLLFLGAVSVPLVANAGLALGLVATMTFCHAGWGNIILPAEVFPTHVVATVTGLGGTLGSWMGALSQIYIGRVVDALGFTPIFMACALLYPVALLLVFQMVGQLGTLRIIPASREI